MARDVVREPLQAFGIAPYHQQVWTGRVCHRNGSVTRTPSLAPVPVFGPSEFHILGSPASSSAALGRPQVKNYWRLCWKIETNTRISVSVWISAVPF